MVGNWLLLWSLAFKYAFLVPFYLKKIKTHKKMQLLTLFPKSVRFKHPKRFLPQKKKKHHKRFQNERKKNQKNSYVN